MTGPRKSAVEIAARIMRGHLGYSVALANAKLLGDAGVLTPPGRKWRHKKRCSIVVEIGRGKMQSEQWTTTPSPLIEALKDIYDVVANKPAKSRSSAEESVYVMAGHALDRIATETTEPDADKKEQPKFIPNPLWCERCHGRGYLVADAEWEPYAVQCDDCKDRRAAQSPPQSPKAIRAEALEDALKKAKTILESYGYSHSDKLFGDLLTEDRHG